MLIQLRTFYIVLFYLIIKLCDTQLVINVRNQGGDVVQENIYANVTDDTVSLEFQRSDGTLITQVIDFRNEVQILKALILGEEERGQSQYQVVCYIFHFVKDSFISSDAMSKLRQKNPGTIRTPEEDLGRTNYTMDYIVVLSHSGLISPYIVDVCSEAGEATYTRHNDIVSWASSQGIPETTYLTTLKKFPTTKNHFLSSNDIEDDVHNNNNDDDLSSAISSCMETKKIWSPCQCHLELCIGWYPCGLKYCKGKGQTRNSVMTYRCGIKTCRKCHLFAYYVQQKQQCLWDE